MKIIETEKDYAIIEDTEGVGIVLMAWLEALLLNPCNELRADMIAHPENYEVVDNPKEWVKTYGNKVR